MDDNMKKVLDGVTDKAASSKPAEPAKKDDKRTVAGKQRIDKASSANLIWDKLTAVLPQVSAWLFVVIGLAVTALSAACLFPAAASFAQGISLAPLILLILAGVAMIVAGVFLMRKQHAKGTLALAILALVLVGVALGFIVDLSAESVNAAAKGWFIAACIVGIVAALVFVVGTDLAFNMGITRYFREMFGELKKLTWLSGKDLFSHTLAVLVFVVGMALLIYLLDTIFGFGFSAISKIKIG